MLNICLPVYLLSLRLGKPNCDTRVRFMVRFSSNIFFMKLDWGEGPGYDP